MATLVEVERELGRVVDRLNSMSLEKAAAAAPACLRAAHVLLDQTLATGGHVPDEARIAELAPQGLGSLIAVLGDDLLTAARDCAAPDLTPARDALVELRRSLP